MVQVVHVPSTATFAAGTGAAAALASATDDAAAAAFAAFFFLCLCLSLDDDNGIAATESQKIRNTVKICNQRRHANERIHLVDRTLDSSGTVVCPSRSFRRKIIQQFDRKPSQTVEDLQAFISFSSKCEQFARPTDLSSRKLVDYRLSKRARYV